MKYGKYRWIALSLLSCLILSASSSFALPPENLERMCLPHETRPIGATFMTPEERFEDLEDWPYESKYIEVEPGNLKMAYIDVGSQNGKTVLLVHGNPIWGYSFRDMIPLLVQKGYRVIVPDLIGFGKSEKPIKQQDYSYTRGVEWLTSFIENLNLSNINLFAQDWGGLISLRVLANNQRLFDRVLISNAGMPTNDFDPGPEFDEWEKVISKTTSDFSQIVQIATLRTLSPGEIKAYQAPFPEGKEGYNSAPRAFPSALPSARNQNFIEDMKGKRALKRLEMFNKPFLTIFAPDEAEVAQNLIKNIPGARNMKHRVYNDMGHFSQDDAGEKLANDLIELIENY